jgi:hypothetical protein
MSTSDLPPEVPPVDSDLLQPGDISLPAAAAMDFLLRLGDEPLDVDGLAFLVTPESVTMWGDFEAAAARLKAFGPWSTVSRGESLAEDVVLVALFRDTTDEVHYSLHDAPIRAAGFVGVMYRPTYSGSGWKVHRIDIGRRPTVGDFPHA